MMLRTVNGKLARARPLAYLARDFSDDGTIAAENPIPDMEVVYGYSEWSVGSNYLQHADETGTNLVMAMFGGVANMHLRARVGFVADTDAGSEDLWIAVRYQDADNMIAARIDNGDFKISKRIAGSISTLTTDANIDPAQATDYDVEISAVGTLFRARLLTTAGVVLSTLAATDTSLDRGGIAFRSYNSTMRIRSFTAKALP